jgi:hypothetical protein
VVTAIFANLIGIPVAETITVIAVAMKALPIYVFYFLLLQWKQNRFSSYPFALFVRSV